MSSSVEIFLELRDIFRQESLENLKRAASYYKNDRGSLAYFVRSHVHSKPRRFPALPDKVDPELEKFLQEQYRTLSEVLPDADPTYLEESFNTHVGIKGGMEAFIIKAIEYESYPKKSVPNVEKVKFDVKLYCDMVPDPLGSFSHKNYIMSEVMIAEAIAYLSKIFGEDKRAEISSIVETEQSLYLAYRKMREIVGEAFAQLPTIVKTDQPKTFDEAPDYGQVFEKLFIENEGVILSFLSKKREDEEAEFKCNQTLHKCSICLGLTTNSKMIKICQNGHEMCVNCVRNHTEVLYHQSVLFFPCAFVDCKFLISNTVLRYVWDSNRFSKLLEDRIFDSNRENHNKVPCPYCVFLNEKSHSSEIVCTSCLKNFCVTCRKAAHLPLECNEKENKLCKLVEESMTQELVRTCPKCFISFIKESNGCNNVQCGKCKFHICYVCRKVLEHPPCKHFYGQGQMPSEAPGRCPLYTDINTLHVSNVIESGKKALQKLKSENPDIELFYNPLAVLPKQEASDAVPHQY